MPGSVLTVKVDTTDPLAAGMSERTDFFFDNSPVFKLGPGAEAANVHAFARFDSATPLRSGWAWGQKYLEGGVAAVEARLGKGRVVLYGPESCSGPSRTARSSCSSMRSMRRLPESSSQ